MDPHLSTGLCIIAYGCLLLGLGLLMKDSPEGYQDQSGFHYGKPPEFPREEPSQDERPE